MKRLLSLLCAALLLVNTAVAEGVFALPKDLRIIEEEAFLTPARDGETSFSDPDTIVIPEGTEKIGSRAFANRTASRIDLPVSLSSIADDAFEGCGNATLYVWRDSYAHQWCMNHDVRYAVLDAADDEAVYEVHSVETAVNDDGDTVFRSVVTTTEACILRVDVLDDAGESVLSSSTATVEANQSLLTVDILPSAGLPQYYVLRAVLEDADGNPLCAFRTNSRYTSAYDQFVQQTPEDFPEETVLDFGDSGFAVLADGVIPLNAAATESGSSYTFAASTALNAGDIVQLDVDGTKKVVKIASIADNGNGTVTVVQDTSAGFDELYSFINVSGEMVADDVQAASLDDEGMTFSFKESISIGSVRVGYDVNARIRATFLYDKESEYLDTSILIDTDGSLDVFFGEKYDTWKKNNAPSITLFNTGVKIPRVNIEGTFKVTVPVNVQASVGGNAYIGFNRRYGFIYNSVDGFQKVEESNSSTANADLTGQFAIKVGPEVSLNLQLFDFLIGRVGGQAGALLEGKVTNPSGEYGDSTDSMSRHACDQCVDMDLSADVNLRATLTGKVGKVSVTCIDFNIGAYKEKIKDFYLSFDNDPESVHGGEIVFGEGTCPNLAYRAQIFTYGLDDKQQTGVPVSVTGEGNDCYTGESPFAVYLYPGLFSASATIDGVPTSKDFTMAEVAQIVALTVKKTTIDGVVKDNATWEPIEGAGVELTLPDGSVRSTTTDADGYYIFKNLPGGTFSITAAAAGYKSSTLSDLTFSVGSNNGVNLSLEVNMDSDEIIIRRIVDYMGEDMVQQMKDDSISLKSNFYYYVPDDGVEGDPIMLYYLDLRTDDDSCYPKITFDIDLYRQAQAALFHCGAFELSEADIATLMQYLYTEDLVDKHVYLDCGVTMSTAESPLYEVVTMLCHSKYWTAPEGYSELWHSSWRYDKMYSNNKPD